MECSQKMKRRRTMEVCSQTMKRRRKMKDCSETMIVPEELLIEILLRLPVKSLARFKCVSKLWFSLISDSSFARSHYDLALAPTHTHLLSSGDCLEIASIDFNAPSLHDYTTEIFRPPIPQLPPHCYPRIRGSCRGFILFDLNSDLYIWNPCTGVQRRIPSPPSYVDPQLGFKGFGYDSSTDDYLVTLGYYNHGIEPNEIGVVIFSVRANAWRQFDGIIPETLKYLHREIASWRALFLNGAIHWIALGLGPGAPEEVKWDVIVGFHLTERVFFEIALPDGFPAFVLHPVIGGFLSVLPMNWPETDYKLLVMEEYNRAQSSWKYLPFPNHLQSEQGLDPHPLLVTVGGDIVAIDTGFRELIKLNGKAQVLERRDYHDYPDRARPHRCPRNAVVHMHSHTLLSLPCQAQDV